VQETNVLIRDSREVVDEDMVHRQYCCPGCLTILSGEVTRADAEPASTFGVVDADSLESLRR